MPYPVSIPVTMEKFEPELSPGWVGGLDDDARFV